VVRGTGQTRRALPYGATSLTHTCRGSACTGNVTQSKVVIIDNFAAKNLRVNLLSRTQLFLLCIHGPATAITLRASSVRFAYLAVFAAPQNSKRIVGLRFGLLGLYWGTALNAIGVFHRVKFDSLAITVILLAEVVMELKRSN